MDEKPSGKTQLQTQGTDLAVSYGKHSVRDWSSSLFSPEWGRGDSGYTRPAALPGYHHRGPCSPRPGVSSQKQPRQLGPGGFHLPKTENRLPQVHTPGRPIARPPAPGPRQDQRGWPPPGAQVAVSTPVKAAEHTRRPGPTAWLPMGAAWGFEDPQACVLAPGALPSLT